jgi:hypothetical protein
VSDELVLVASARLDEPTRRLVTDACDHARVRPVFLGPAGPEWSNGPLNPALLIAALPLGTRTIPEDVATLAGQVYQALPLLLLCSEPLVRNSVSLQGGRVTLLGQPLTREKISARIRTAVVGGVAAGAESGRTVDERGVRVREMRGREWWAGMIARDPRRESGAADAGELLPSVCKLGRHGVAGLLPSSPRNPVPATALQQAALSLASGLPLERASASLEAAVGSDAAAVWFSPATYQWSFYVPVPGLELWIYSPLRLPSAWRLTPTDGAGPWRTMAAAGGDVIVAALGEPGPYSAEDFRSGEVWRVAEGGGPALLDHLEARLASSEGAGSALIVELR